MFKKEAIFCYFYVMLYEKQLGSLGRLLMMIGRVVEHFLTSQNRTYWKITNTKHEKGKKLQNVHNLLPSGFQIMT